MDANHSLQVANLHAFTKLYGVLRWFHPSDAASAVDWDQFAVNGVRRILNASDVETLRSELKGVIDPIAPTVQLIGEHEQFAVGPPRPPASAEDAKVVAWEHQGYGDDSRSDTYASKRRHRPRSVVAPGTSFYALSQTLDAAPFRGTRLRLRGKIRTANRGLGRIWLRVDRGRESGFFDNMRDRPVDSSQWTTAEIVGEVASDATRIAFGALMLSSGTAWYDDIELDREARDGSWSPVEVKNPGFETEDALRDWTPGIGADGSSSPTFEGWHVSLDTQSHASGHASLRIDRDTKLLTDELFEDAPDPGESVDLELAPGLRARVPISLFSMGGRTLGDDPGIAKQLQANSPLSRPDGFDPIWGLADIIVLWNALEHFWPYWDTVSVDWNAELDMALAQALNDRTVDDHAKTLERLSGGAPDGHAETRCPGQARLVRAPFEVDLVEGQVVVTATSDHALAVGDVITRVDGRPALELLNAYAALASGSQQWKVVKARQRFGSGSAGSVLALTIRRANKEQDLAVVRTGQTAHEAMSAPIERFEDGIYYIDLRRVSLKDVDGLIDKLSAAPGVIFDVRGYPNNTHNVLSHLFTNSVNLTEGMTIPHIIRPDHVAGSVTSWGTQNTMMPAQQPHISGRVAFLTDARASSYAESIMRLVEHYHLGAIVGAATAGTNGNIAEIAEPSGCRTMFTALRVTRIDGKRSHLSGIQPTIPVSRTLAGILAGRDEVLEKALAYVRTTAK